MLINAVLIPGMASSGAAIGTLIAEAAVLVYQYWKLKDLTCGILEKVHWKILIFAVLIAGAVAIWVKVLNLGCVFHIWLLSACLFILESTVLLLLVAGEPLLKEIWGQILKKIQMK